MPKVPITDNVVPFSGAPAGPMPSETDFAMAAATMHAQGRLFAQSAQEDIPGQKEMLGKFPGQEDQGGTTKTPWSSLSPDEQKQLLKNSYTPQTEGERNKYDETLNEKGSVVLDSKKAFGAKEWQDRLFDKGTERIDLPDGRVILRKRGKEPLVS